MENIGKELGMEFLKNLVVRTNKVNFMVSCSEEKETQRFGEFGGL